MTDDSIHKAHLLYGHFVLVQYCIVLNTIQIHPITVLELGHHQHSLSNDKKNTSD